MHNVESASARYLIVNADDFGQSYAINRGVVAAFEHGVVTSASLMVRWPAARDAAGFAGRHPRLSLGLHIDLGEWAYRAGAWEPLYEVVPMDDEVAVAAEIERQLTAFRDLTGGDPTHLDSHQHVHLHEPVRGAVWSLADRLGVPTRHFAPRIQHCGSFYGQAPDGTSIPDAVGVEQFISIAKTLPPGPTELGCHPGEDGGPGSMYRDERRIEVATLCDPRVRSALGDLSIQLCSFHDVARLPVT